ncbi:MAG: hypothetical protein CMJ19_17035 [Phycisphaeraceae bacterium]|nr:hypothetical protein [Phycisphaeraceae bacterium]
MYQIKLSIKNSLAHCFAILASLLVVTHTAGAATQLDVDGNGLYDDVERLTLVNTFKQVCPSLKDADFDADGDGQVTVLEQTQGRHPLSMTIGKEVLASGVQIPWGIDIFSEWITCAYLQEDVAPGRVAQHIARGTRTRDASQQEPALQPSHITPGDGIFFAENLGQQLTMERERDARWNYRWCIFTFRIDGDSGRDSKTVLLDLNKGNGPSKSSPKIWFDKQTGLHVQYAGRQNAGTDVRVMSTRDIHTDGKTWNVVVCGIRYGQMYAQVNGIDLQTNHPQPPRYSGELVYDTQSVLGKAQSGNSAWAYDALVFGLTEPSEAMVSKMTGWAAHRLNFADRLPKDHPYRYKRPVLDQEDFPDRYVHDNDKWLKWGEQIKKSVTRVNSGGQPIRPLGYERVFYDDFREFRIDRSTSGTGDLWMAYGFNTAVGIDAKLIHPGREPNVYPYDAKNQKQTLSVLKKGKHWYSAGLYTVNDMGYGYTWKGAKVFRVRCMFPNVEQKELKSGLFPAFWSYDPDFLVWRTANRIECDWFEFDAINGYWYNGVSTHYHYAHINNIFAKNSKSYKRFKIYSGELTEEKSKIPGGLYFWDGEYHTWEFIVGDNMTFINVTIKDENGNDKWVEVCRSPTAPTYLQRLDLQLDTALKAKYGDPKQQSHGDFTIDWVEVLQKTTQLNEFDKPFTARPQITGTIQAGKTITCQANLQGVTDVRYYWFADGYPLTYGPSDSYTLTANEVGKEIRCMVKAVGALNMPEAWSDSLK